MSRHEDLSAPRQNRRFGVHYDREAFGEFSELIARALGTARFLIFQSIVCIVWLGWNITMPDGWRFDPNPFGVLTLALSLQAAYAAPLILLAQNRQEDRDRQQLELDRAVAARTQSETEYLARELADEFTGRHHHHIMCDVCGEVRDIDIPETLEHQLDSTLAALARQSGYLITHHRVDLVGRCRKCQ